MAGPRLASMAWRNLWRNRRRTVLTLSSIAFGVFLAVLFTGLGDSNWGKMIDLAARLGGGHVTLQHVDYQDRPSLKRSLQGASELAAAATQRPEVTHTATRIVGHAMLATARESFGAAFVALDPEQESAASLALLESPIDGRMLESAADPGAVLGKQLAENLGLKLGRKLVYTVTDRRGEMVSGLARVVGIVETGVSDLDGSICLLGIDAVRKVVGYAPDEATQVAVFLRDRRETDAATEGFATRLPKKVAALPWHLTLPDLAGFITMKVAGAVFMELLIALLVAAGIFNTLFVSVMERVREFGVLLALGFSPWQVTRLVMWESLWLGVVGLVSAAALLAWPYWRLSTEGVDLSAAMGNTDQAQIVGVTMDSVMHVRIFPEHALAIATIALLATLLAGIYPAVKAGRVEPVESIKLV